MEFLQSTFEEIVETERLLVLTASERYGDYYGHARECSIFVSRSVTAVDHDRTMFGRFFSLMKKHHMLALLSIVRLHKVQAMMSLRQVLEAGASAAFAIANPELHHFADTDEHGLLDPSQALTKKRYQWLDQNYSQKSEWIKAKKDQINLSTAHANIVSSGSTFRVAETGDTINTPFFDVEDDYTVKSDLWQTGSIALTLVDFFYGVNQGRNAIEFCPGFTRHVERLARNNEALINELKSTDRFKQALQRFGSSGT
ncbi:MAG: hypothetical protein ABSD31_18495 [Candidatus Binataceae bacterium]|jgi:hypothetical protein